MKIPQIPNFNFGGKQNVEINSDYEVKEQVNTDGIRKYNTINGTNEVDSIDLSGQVEEKPKKSGTFFELFNQVNKGAIETGATTTPAATSLVNKATLAPTATPTPTKIPINTPAPTKIPINTPKPRVAVPTPASGSSIHKPTTLAEAFKTYPKRDNMTMIKVGNEFFYTIDSMLPVGDMTHYWKSNGMYQNHSPSFYPSGCDITAKYAAYDLMWGKPSSKNRMLNSQGHNGAEITPYLAIQNYTPKDTKSYWERAYQELSQGRPVTVAVQLKTGQNGSRHVVTGVGMKPSVKSAADLNESTILVLDNWDATLKTLEGRRLNINKNGEYELGVATKKWIEILKRRGRISL